MSRLLTADQVRKRVATDHKGRSYGEIGRQFNITDEFARAVLKGLREPSKKFLKAAGYERVVRYRIVSTEGLRNG